MPVGRGSLACQIVQDARHSEHNRLLTGQQSARVKLITLVATRDGNVNERTGNNVQEVSGPVVALSPPFAHADQPTVH